MYIILKFFAILIVDIHTHNSSNLLFQAIRNLTFSEAEKIFSTDETGLFSVGFHPWYVNEYSDKSFEMLEKWANDNRLVLIGECGLDKNSKIALEKQLEVFKIQISLSEKVQKPLIIHCVGYFNKILEIQKQLNPQQLWIIHGFRGKPELAKQLLKAGCALSFGEHFNKKSVEVTPTNKLYIETDESVIPIENTYSQVAIIKNISPDSLTAGETLIQKLIYEK